MTYRISMKKVGENSHMNHYDVTFNEPIIIKREGLKLSTIATNGMVMNYTSKNNHDMQFLVNTKNEEMILKVRDNYLKINYYGIWVNDRNLISLKKRDGYFHLFFNYFNNQLRTSL